MLSQKVKQMVSFHARPPSITTKVPAERGPKGRDIENIWGFDLF